MIEVYLKDVIINGKHGLHAEEAATGGAFKVNLVASYQPINIPVILINETVDYSALFNLVKEKFKQRTLLLETLVTEIAYDVLAKFPVVTKVRVSINKVNAPIKNFQGEVGVSYELNRSNQ